MKPEGERDRKTTLLIIVALSATVLLAVTCLWVIKVWFSTSMPVAPAPAAPLVETSRGDLAPLPNPPPNAPAEGTSTPSIEVFPQSINHSNTCEVTVRFLDAAGEGIPNFAFYWTELDLRERLDLLDAESISGWAPREFARADADGVWHVDARYLSRIAVKPESTVYHHAGKPAGELESKLAKQNIDCLFVPGSDSPSVEIDSSWSLSVTIHVICEYEDGQPYDGFGAWLLRTEKDGRAVSALDREVLEKFPLELTVTGPVDAVLVVNVKTVRAGYKASAELLVALTLERDQSTQYLTIPADPSRTVVTILEVDCTVLPNDAHVQFSIANPTGFEYDRHEVTGPAVVMSRDLTSAKGPLIVNVWGDYTWTSSAIELRPGESKRVYVELAGSGSVRVKIVDEKGKPLSPARLMDGSMIGRGWGLFGSKGGVSKDGLIAYADEEGVAVLPETSAGKRTFCVDALGYKPCLVEAVVTPDLRKDLGAIVLELETSGVTFVLKIPESDDPRSYRADIYVRGGAIVVRYFPHFDADGRVTFDHIRPGSYFIFVQKDDEPGGWNQEFEVEDGKVVEVEVELAKLKNTYKGK